MKIRKFIQICCLVICVVILGGCSQLSASNHNGTTDKNAQLYQKIAERYVTDTGVNLPWLFDTRKLPQSYWGLGSSEAKDFDFKEIERAVLEKAKSLNQDISYTISSYGMFALKIPHQEASFETFKKLLDQYGLAYKFNEPYLRHEFTLHSYCSREREAKDKTYNKNYTAYYQDDAQRILRALYETHKTPFVTDSAYRIIFYNGDAYVCCFQSHDADVQCLNFTDPYIIEGDIDPELVCDLVGSSECSEGYTYLFDDGTPVDD